MINPATGAKRIFIVLILTLLLFDTGWAEQLPPESQSTPQDLLRHARYLASDELLGRGVDTAGIGMARDYIAGEFQKYGLLPGGENGTFYQGLDVDVGAKVNQPSALQLEHDSSLVLNKDWTPLGLSHSGSIDGEIVFAGYGITAKDYDYDDYSGIDVRGKIALVLRYEPPPKNEKSPFRKFPRSSRYATLLSKANNAREHGAIGMILVDLGPRREGEPEFVPLARTLWLFDPALIAAQVKPKALENILEKRGVSLRDLKEKIDREEKPASTLLPGVAASIHVSLERISKRTDNVIGIVPGSDPLLKKEYIVIGAHYDHLGLGYFGTRDASTEGQIHHGADDNASGTAVLMDLAQRLSRLPEGLPRTVVFIAFTGEERGLYGSRYYVTHPLLPIEQAKAMINMDMVGRMRGNRLNVSGIETANEFSGWLTETGQKLGIDLAPSKITDRSDHASFYNRQIPDLLFSTGFHEDYHGPTDTWDKLNVEGMAKVSDIVLAVVKKIAEATEPLTFVRVPAVAPGPKTAEGYGAYLGIIPDFSETKDGVRLAGVRQGGPAEAAGLKQGDVIVALAETKIGKLEDLASFLRGKKPGEKVKILALREGKPLTVEAVLRPRG